MEMEMEMKGEGSPSRELYHSSKLLILSFFRIRASLLVIKVSIQWYEVSEFGT